MNSQNVLQGTIWKFLERIGVFGMQFVVQIILARILAPSDYGTLSILLVFITVSNVIIQNGFNAGIIQRKDVTEDDYSSVLWMTLVIAAFLYTVLFFLAPVMADIYDSSELLWPLRVIAIGMFPGAVNSIQIAKVSKEFEFKKLFFSNITSIVVSGISGITIALMGGGIWALVAQNVINIVISCVVMAVMVRIKFKLYLNFERIKIYLAYGWKLVVSGVLNTVTEQLNGLIIGYKYTTETLGYYSRGMQFPNYGITIVEGTMTGVLLPALSKVQDSREEGKKVMKAALLLSTYLVFPLMAGLAAASDNLIPLILSEKWTGCIPYLKVFCVVFAFYPVHICNLQTLNSVGRSDIYLIVEIIKKVYGVSLSLLMIFLFDTPMAVALCTLVTIPLGWYINSHSNRKIINYGFGEQVRDIFPNLVISMVMFLILDGMNRFGLGYSTILLQIFAGAAYYLLISRIFKIKQAEMMFQMIKHFTKK